MTVLIKEAADEVKAALEALARNARTSGDVADRLEAKDCRGLRRLGFACPVSTYLESVLTVRVKLMVDRKTVFIREEWHSQETAKVRIPPVIQSFIKDFDEGRFAALSLGGRIREQRADVMGG